MYNRVEAQTLEDLSQYRGGPPPATREFVGEHPPIRQIVSSSVKLLWSDMGNSVAVLIDGVPVAFTAVRLYDSFNRYVVTPGPFGMPWDEELYAREFGTR